MPIDVKVAKDIDKRERNRQDVSLRELRDGFLREPRQSGLPTLIAKLRSGGNRCGPSQSENGMLGIGPYPIEGEEDADLINRR